MPSYVAFLRAINLGAKRKFPKDAIKASVEAVGCTGVETYINTGNVRFDCSLRSRARVEATLEEAFEADRGFAVPTIAYTPDELCRIAEDIDDLHDDALERHYVLLLKADPSPDIVDAVQALNDGPHRTVVRNRAAHLLLGPGYNAGSVDPLRVEKLLGVTTNRNHTVLRAITEKWC
jgi:uncharacterized protein (DUF1697 family)